MSTSWKLQHVLHPLSFTGRLYRIWTEINKRQYTDEFEQENREGNEEIIEVIRHDQRDVNQLVPQRYIRRYTQELREHSEMAFTVQDKVKAMKELVIARTSLTSCL